MPKCPICNSKSSYLFTSKIKRKIYNCRLKDCNHFFTPITKENQGICELPEDIQRESDKDLSVYRERNQRMLNLFLRKTHGISTPFNWLDYGSGSAHISRLFKEVLKENCNIYCCELNQIYEEFYRFNNLIHLNSLEKVEKKFDLIYLVEVIEHLEDPIKTLKELSKSLKEKGKIFISTPMGMKREFLTRAYEADSHLHFFSKKSLSFALKEAGFLNIEFDFFEELYLLPEKKDLIYKFKLLLKKNNLFSSHISTFSGL